MKYLKDVDKKEFEELKEKYPYVILKRKEGSEQILIGNTTYILRK